MADCIVVVIGGGNGSASFYESSLTESVDDVIRFGPKAERFTGKYNPSWLMDQENNVVEFGLRGHLMVLDCIAPT